MKRAFLTLLLLVVAAPADAAVARPIRDSGGLLSCPDPSVLDAHVAPYRYYLACTSDLAADAFPIRGSNDLIHWQLLSYVFPADHQPWWALPSPLGRYWSPAMYRIGNRWTIYFAAQYNSNKVTLRYPDGFPLQPAMWVLGVATSTSLSGPWQSRILHYRGQFNRISPEQETYGGVIDPSMVQNPRTGQRYLFWAEQHTSIWAGKLSADGLRLDPHVHPVLWIDQGWDCASGCTVEGPEEIYRDGWFYLFFSGASTWAGTYAIGAAVATDPMQGQFKRLSDGPILRAGHGWLGPGGSSHPVMGPDGSWYFFYHAATAFNAGHISDQRILMMSRLNWDGIGGYYPLINNGQAGADDTSG